MIKLESGKQYLATIYYSKKSATFIGTPIPLLSGELISEGGRPRYCSIQAVKVIKDPENILEERKSYIIWMKDIKYAQLELKYLL
jgi:hypothetical protein